LVKVVKKISTESFKPSVIYDLDGLAKVHFPDLDSEDLTPIREREVGNNDVEVIKSKLVGGPPGAQQVAVSKNDAAVTPLAFESRFESGNLRRVVQVRIDTRSMT
jgi:hypothetical protein